MSQFVKDDSAFTQELPLETDFDRAVKLPSGGSTCDLFRTRWQRREVFVKRLKEEYRTKPLYLDAMDKEFDVGAGLQHPSLPRYLEFHRDYIVMDYIDGATLANMIKHHDPWLKAEKHVLRLLGELVDVVDYLHRHNVVHCDIKPDNIMITSNSKNLVLVDFDKSYTDALCDTSGHPGKYGLPVDEVGKEAIDFHGIAMVAERLKSGGYGFKRYNDFVKACYGEDVDCEMLADILSSPAGGLNKNGLFPALGLAAAGVIVWFIAGWMERSDSQQVESRAVGVVDENRLGNVQFDTTKTEAEIQLHTSTPIGKIVAPLTQEDIHAEAKRRAEELDKRIQPYFNELQRGVDRLATLRKDTVLTGQQLLDSIRVFSDKADERIAEAFAILNDMYPGNTDRDAWRIMSYSKAYTGYTRRIATEGKEYRKEYERRFAREGRLPN